MISACLAVLLVGQSAVATDFGIRAVGFVRPIRATTSRPPEVSRNAKAASASSWLELATRIGSRNGRVTSTWRSAEHNRRVGGVRNSWHLSGRAVDIARSPSVSHAAIAAEMRRSGLFLIESLDEGDHSHFAFGDPSIAVSRKRPAVETLAEVHGEALYFQFRGVPLASR